MNAGQPLLLQFVRHCADHFLEQRAARRAAGRGADVQPAAQVRPPGIGQAEEEAAGVHHGGRRPQQASHSRHHRPGRQRSLLRLRQPRPPLLLVSGPGRKLELHHGRPQRRGIYIINRLGVVLNRFRIAWFP